MEGDIVSAKISAIEKYGAFASLDEEYSGLIHVSEITEKYVSDVTDYLNIGDTIKVKIISIPEKHNQLRLSAKGLNDDVIESKRKKIKETVFGFYLLKSALPGWIEEKMKEISKNSQNSLDNHQKY